MDIVFYLIIVMIFALSFGLFCAHADLLSDELLDHCLEISNDNAVWCAIDADGNEEQFNFCFEKYRSNITVCLEGALERNKRAHTMMLDEMENI